MRRIFTILALLGACGGGGEGNGGLDPCGPNGECPAGFECNPTDHLCYARGAIPDAGPGAPDAPIFDAPPTDDTPPDTTITSKPSAISGPDVTFLFESTEAGSFECQLDGADFAACASPLNLTALGATPDPHVFAVRARDLAGNVDDSPATYSWTVDPNALDTNIVSAPPAVSGPAVSFGFSSTRPGTFECRLQPTEADFSACTSPKAYAGLTGDGISTPYTFSVRAVDNAQNRDDSPAIYPFNVDSTPPVLAILAPTGTTNGRPTVRLTTEAGATYTCTIDGGTGFSCGASTPVPSDLASGSHTLAVHAVDPRSNIADGSVTWTVDATPPTITLVGPAEGSLTDGTVSFTYTVSDGTVSCTVDGAAPAGGCGAPVNLNLATGAHNFAVSSVDGVGNSRTVTRAWMVDATPPSITLIGPSNGVRTTTRDLRFISSVNEGTRTCQSGLTGGALAAIDCDAILNLAAGDYTYRVNAVDGVGNPSNQTRTFTIPQNISPLNVEIVGPQSGGTYGTSVWITFLPGFSTGTGIIDPATILYECMIDWKNPVPCYANAYGLLVNGVAVGLHTVSVRGTVDTSSIVHNGYFQVAAGAPAFVITEPVRGSVLPQGPLTLAHNGGNVQCAIDGGSLQNCPSGGTAIYPGPGDHDLHFALAGGFSYDHAFSGVMGCGRVTDDDTEAQWPMQGTQQVVDQSGHGRHLMLGSNGTIETSDPTYTSGKDGYAMLFDDAAARMTSTTASHSFAGGMSIEAWVNIPPTAGPSPSGILVAPTLASGQHNRLILELVGDGTVRARLEGTNVSTLGRPVSGCFAHVMATYDPVGHQLHMYVNRGEEFDSPVAVPAGTALGNVTGYTLGPFSAAGVSIDDVRISSRPRTVSETPPDFCIQCSTP